jgi:Ca2+-binding RTX toxin-like protein
MAFIQGTDQAEWIEGGQGDDVLTGLGGHDVLDGGAGSDRLEGGFGTDWLRGGEGRDVFAFGSWDVIWGPGGGREGSWTRLDTGLPSWERDVVADFTQGEDIIDLSNLLRLQYRHLNEDGAYSFIGTGEFSGKGPEVRYVHEGERTVLYFDAGGGIGRFSDGEPDGAIELVGRHDLTAEDFWL